MTNLFQRVNVCSFLSLFLIAAPLAAGELARASRHDGGSIPATKFVSPIAEGADPWVIRDPQSGRYLWCMSQGNRAIAIHASDRLTSLGAKHIVWQAPDRGPASRQVWAPELHLLDGQWHIYFAASDGKNENHLAYVLQSKTADPLGEYELHGPLATGAGADGRSPNIWAIDMTVLQLRGQRYALWSGWDAPGTDRQYLYIAPMKSPAELAGPRVRLCDNDDYLWERIEPTESQRGLHEGPQVFQAKGQTSVIYSCAASWLPTYKLGLLELQGDDPLDPKSWKKRQQPVFASTEEVYGVGHSCFVRSVDDGEWWHVYHAKRNRDPGWRRVVHVQPMNVDKRGFPAFGRPQSVGAILDRPSGDILQQANLPLSVSLKTSTPQRWTYYGHHQFVEWSTAGLHLGQPRHGPINDYRSGEKVVLDSTLPNDIAMEVSIDFRGDQNARDAGILFRCSGASVGYDAQRGYFAGLIPRTGLVILGKTDGSNWTELARATTAIDVKVPQGLRVEIKGDLIAIYHNHTRAVATSDTTYAFGGVGLRVVDTHAVFTDLCIDTLPKRSKTANRLE